MTSPYLYLFGTVGVGGSGNLSPIVVSIVLLALLTRLPSWYAVPTTKVRKEPGLSSTKWMGTTPQAP
jgi:hypothetical protein